MSAQVKTKDRTLIVQAETQPELSQWVKSFEIAKQKALEDPASTDCPDLDGPRGQDAAFAITPPSAPELAASGADSGLPQDEGSVGGLDRIGTLPLPEMNLAARNSFDVTSSRRQTTEGESGRDHAARIIQKLDLHRKSTIGAQATGGPAMPSSSAGGIASLIVSNFVSFQCHLGQISYGISPIHACYVASGPSKLISTSSTVC